MPIATISTFSVCLRGLLRRAVDDVEVVLRDLSAEDGVLGRPLYPRQHEALGELVLAEGPLALRGQHTVDEHQSVVVAVVGLLIETANKTWTQNLLHM